MAWINASATAVIVLLAFWAPGLIALTVLRVTGLARFALAPLVSTLMCGFGAIACGVIGARWSIAASGVVCVLVVALLAIGRLRSGVAHPQPPRATTRRERALTVVGVVTGTLTVLVPFAVGMQDPDRSINAWDAPFHLNALEFIRETGRASPFLVQEVDGNGPNTGVYPDGWHILASLVPAWPSRGVVFAVAAYVPLVAAWTIGLAFLARTLFPESRGVAQIAPFVAATGAVPVYAMSTMGIVANAWALSLAPACAGVLVLAWRYRTTFWRLLAVACVAGLGIAHPGPVLALVVLALPTSVPPVLQRIRRLWGLSSGRVVIVVGCGLAVGLTVLVGTRSVLRDVVAQSGRTTSGWPWSFFDVVNGTQGVTVASGAVLVALAVAGALKLWNARRHRKLIVGWIVLTLLPVVADPRIPLSMFLIRPWYSDVERLAPVAWSITIVLASYGLVESVRRLIDSGRLDVGAHPRAALPVVACAVCLAAVVPTVFGARNLAVRALSASPTTPTYVSRGELAMIYRLPNEINAHEAVLGSTYSGASQLYGLTGQRVTLPYHFTHFSPAVRYISSHLNDLGSDPILCQDLAVEDIHYLYVEPHPLADWSLPGNIKFPPPRGVRLVDQGGTAAVYEITACS